MKLSYSWLQDYVKTSLSPEALGDKFRMTSSEVEQIIDWNEMLRGVVVGKVLTVTPHPNADRLRVATVDVGTGKKTIVCGGTNLAESQTVPVALPGATIHPLKGEAFTIQTTKLRGVSSEGMICATEEIGVNLPSVSHHIWVLDKDYKPGTPLAEALGLNDQVLDLEITPNRPDLLSYYGLAREVGAFEKHSLIEPPIATLEDTQNTQKLIHSEIEDPKHCQRYSALCMENVQVKPSPWWLQARLLLAGIRPINTVVDAGNYVMLELGQPLHIFDLDKLPKSSKNSYKVRVRNARSGETVRLLDGKIRDLAIGDIVICDSEDRVIDLAGIMGDEHTSISSKTSRVFIESAHFDGPQIRRTSRRLGLRSEASTRFEKGLDPELTITALKRAAYLLQEIAGATVCSQISDHYGHSRPERPRLHLTFDQIQQVLGVHISAPECKSILQKLGFQIPKLNKSSFETIPPTWRRDIHLAEDVIEEIIRIWGYERIPLTLPSGMVKPPQPNRQFERLSTLRHSLASQGAYECIHQPFASAANLAKAGFKPQNSLRLPNPLSLETEYLLPSHLPAFLQNIATVNLAQENLTLFEIGKVFAPPATEQLQLSLLLRSSGNAETLYRQAKTLLESACQELRIQPVEFVPTKENGLDILAQGKKCGEMNLLTPEILEPYKIRRGRTVVFLEIAVESLLSQPEHKAVYNPLPAYPSIERDMTLVVESQVPVAAIAALLEKQHNAKIMLAWSMQGIYSGKPLPEGKKSVTLHFIYNSPERTLEDSTVNEDQQRLARLFTSELQALIN